MRTCKRHCTGQPGCTGTIYIAATTEPLPGEGEGNRIKIGFTHYRTPGLRAKDLARSGYQIIWHYQRDDHGQPADWDTEQLIHQQIKNEEQPAWFGREYYEVTAIVIAAIRQHLIDRTELTNERANERAINRLQRMRIADVSWHSQQVIAEEATGGPDRPA